MLSLFPHLLGIAYQLPLYTVYAPSFLSSLRGLPSHSLPSDEIVISIGSQLLQATASQADATDPLLRFSSQFGW